MLQVGSPGLSFPAVLSASASQSPDQLKDFGSKMFVLVLVLVLVL